MAKTEKFKAGSGGRWKKILIALAVLIVVVAGIVLGITYWPANVSDINNAVRTNVVSTEDETEVFEFISQKQAEFVNNGDLKYATEMEVFSLLHNASLTANAFYAIHIDASLSGKVARRDIKALQTSIKENNIKYGKIADYIEEHEDEMDSYAVLKTSWENIRVHYADIVANYQKIYTKLYDFYDGLELKGVYGNDVMILSVQGVKSYYEAINQKLFGKDGFVDEAVALNLAKGLNNYVLSIYSKNEDVISNYYINKNIQNKAEEINKLEPETEGKVNFTYILSNNYDCSELALSPAQTKYINSATKFLKGELAL